MPQTGRKLEHLRRVVYEHPEYRDILSLFVSIFSHVEGKEDSTGISFPLSGRAAREKMAAGTPLLSPGAMAVDRERAGSFLSGILYVMRGASREPAAVEELDRIGRALAEHKLDPASLFGACMRRERKPLEDAAASIRVRAPLLTFIFEIPLKTALSLAAETVDPASVEGWDGGDCPVCGARPGIEELAGEEGKRYLCCSACEFRWPYRRLKCPYCGNQDPEKMSYFTAGEGPTRVSVCGKCSRYIKTRDSRKGNADVPLEAEDLSTLHLDMIAAREGFERGR